MSQLTKKDIEAILGILNRDSTAEVKKDKNGNVLVLDVKKSRKN